MNKKQVLKLAIRNLRYDFYKMEKCLEDMTENGKTEEYSYYVTSSLSKISFLLDLGLIKPHHYKMLFRIWKNPKNIKFPF